MGDDLGDIVSARRLEEAIWALFEQAASKVGCPTADIEAYYKTAIGEPHRAGLSGIGGAVGGGDCEGGTKAGRLRI